MGGGSGRGGRVHLHSQHAMGGADIKFGLGGTRGGCFVISYRRHNLRVACGYEKINNNK